ncbi:MAG: FAD-dependent oxidoreductase [Acetobacteraceae bacterium]
MCRPIRFGSVRRERSCSERQSGGPGPDRRCSESRFPADVETAAGATAGPRAHAGRHVERGRFGGTRVNTGCTPTKTLIASAYAMHLARRGAEYGFSTVDVTVDMQRVKARKDDVAGRSNRGVERSLKNLKNCRVYEGHARFASAGEVQVGQEILSAPRFFISVGARAAVPEIPGLDRIDYLTNSSMMDIDFLPQHLLVLGGSYVGLESGQI